LFSATEKDVIWKICPVNVDVLCGCLPRAPQPLTFELKIGEPVYTPAMGNVHGNFVHFDAF